MPFQERFVDEPFWMLVGCVLVNRTRWVGSAQHVHEEMRSRWPTPEDVASAPIDEIEAVVSRLGLSGRRSRNISGLASSWVSGNRDVPTMPGCGRYAADSWSIFVEGRRDVEPTDRVLKSYLAEGSR